MSGYFNLINLTRSNTNTRILADLFENKKNEWLYKREIEKYLALQCIFKNKSFPIRIDSIEDAMNKLSLIPGDIQRDLRTFSNNNNFRGLEKKGKGKNIKYKWNPKRKDDLVNFNESLARNIFKTAIDRQNFIDSKSNKCELCESKISDTNTRFAVDHFRAHSTYNIDNEKIAVLLCEKCNNIHHNFDAVKVIDKHKSDLRIITNWVSIEKRIKKDFSPNDTDLKLQKKIIKNIINYNNKTSNTQVEHLFKSLNLDI